MLLVFIIVIEQYRNLSALMLLTNFLRNASNGFTAAHALLHQLMDAIRRFLLLRVTQ